MKLSNSEYMRHCVPIALVYLLFALQFPYAINVLAILVWVTGILLLMGVAMQWLSADHPELPLMDRWARLIPYISDWKILISLIITVINMKLLFNHQWFLTLGLMCATSTFSYSLCWLSRDYNGPDVR